MSPRIPNNKMYASDKSLARRTQHESGSLCLQCKEMKVIGGFHIVAGVL